MVRQDVKGAWPPGLSRFYDGEFGADSGTNIDTERLTIKVQ